MLLASSSRVRGFAFIAVLAASLGGCAGQAPEEATGNAVEALTNYTRAQVIARAEEWVAARLQYCQSANHARDYDTACSTYCNRTNNAAWDPYRSDCSGLVSWSWGLPAPGRITTEFAPYVNDITHAIPASSLMPGDAVNNRDHIMLFKHWVVAGHSAVFIEEPGCSSSTPYAHEFTSSVTISGSTIHVAWNGMTFTAIRYDHVIDPPTCTLHCSGNSVVDATCHSTACGSGDTCSQAGGMSAHCVSLSCVPNATTAPVAHEVCVSSHEIAACSSQGDLGRPTTCATGETCVSAHGTAHCEAVMTSTDAGTMSHDGGVVEHDASVSDATPSEAGDSHDAGVATDARVGSDDAGGDVATEADGSTGTSTSPAGCSAAPGRHTGLAPLVAALALAYAAARSRRSRRAAARAR